MRYLNRLNFDVDDILSTVGLRRTSQAGGVGGFFVGLGLGLIGGAAASLLLTPYTGSEAREKLLRASEDLSRTVSTKVGEIAQRVQTPGTTPSVLTPSNATYSTPSTRIGSV